MEKRLFNQWCWEVWSTTCKRMKLEHFLTPYTKINSNLTKDLDVTPEIIKLLEKSIGRTFSDINHSMILYDPPSQIMGIKPKINKWDLIKLQSFCTAKETQNKVKRQPLNSLGRILDWIAFPFFRGSSQPRDQTHVS